MTDDTNEELMSLIPNEATSFKKRIPEIIKNYISSIANDSHMLSSISNQISINFENGIQMIRSKMLKEITKKKIKKQIGNDAIIKRKKIKKWKNFVNALNNTNSSCNNTFPSTCKENSRMRKEKDDLKECTFRPVINTNSSTSFYKNKKSQQNSSVYERLYTDYIKIGIIRDNVRNENEKELANTLPFSPTLYETPKVYAIKVSRSFSQRLKSFSKRKSQNTLRNLSTLEREYKNECSFRPYLNRNRYSLSQKRLIRENNLKEKNEEMKKKKQPKRNVDLTRLYDLYNSYKLKQKKIQQIQTEIDFEEGITFHPNLSTSYTNIDRRYKNNLPDFKERNQEFIENKKNFLTEKQEEEFEYQKPKRHYNKKEKEVITQKIIDRLYGNGLQKQLLRNNIITNYMKINTECNNNDE